MLRCGLTLAFLLISCVGYVLPSAAAVTARISTEQLEDHPLTATLHRFAELVSARSNGEMLFSVYSEGRLYTDSEVPRMVALGRVDMAVTACNLLEPYAPAFTALALPTFFDVDRNTDPVLDSDLSRALSASLEKQMHVVVLGRWLTRGAPVLFGVRQKLTSFDEVKGRVTRTSGGLGNRMRLIALGALPVASPMSELMQLLRQGQVGAILTPPEVVAQWSLWRYGVTDGIDVGHNGLRYVPLVSRQFWDKLPPALQEVLKRSWEDVVDDQRQASKRSEVETRKELAAHGIVLHRPGENEIRRVKQMLLDGEKDIIERVGIEAELLGLIQEAVNRSTGNGK